MDNMQKMKNLLLRHEGFRNKAYKDTVGKLTIGIGRNLIDKGITEEEALYLVENDINECEEDLLHIFDEQWFSLSENRQMVLIDMRFNLGPGGFRKFINMIIAVQEEKFDVAANEMLNSLWAKQVKGRSTELADMMKKG